MGARASEGVEVKGRQRRNVATFDTPAGEEARDKQARFVVPFPWIFRISFFSPGTRRGTVLRAHWGQISNLSIPSLVKARSITDCFHFYFSPGHKFDLVWRDLAKYRHPLSPVPPLLPVLPLSHFQIPSYSMDDKSGDQANKAIASSMASDLYSTEARVSISPVA